MKLLKNKRGAAMESAILFMAVVFSLCLLLTTVISTSHLQVRVSKKQRARRLEIEQIGQYYVANPTVFELSEEEKLKYEIEKTNTSLKLKTKNESVVLYIELDSDKKVITWKYSGE